MNPSILDPMEIARFQAWLMERSSKEDPPLTEVEPFLEYLSKLTTIVRDMGSRERRASPEELLMAGHLFYIGCTRMKLLDPPSTRRLVDALVLGELPSSPYVYQILTYILRIEKHECGVNLALMMPLIALMELKWYPLHPNRSTMLVNVLQSFSICSERYTRKSILCYDPLDLLFKLQRVITHTARDPRYEGKQYLGYTLDSLRYVASVYLAVVCKRICEDPSAKAQASSMLAHMLSLHQTVVNTHFSQHRT